MKRVVLRMLFKNTPHFMDIAITESEARRLMTKWKDGDKNGCLEGYDQAQDRYWTVLESEVATMFTIDIFKIEEEQRRQQQQAQQQAQKQTQIQQKPPSFPPYHGWGGQASGN